MEATEINKTLDLHYEDLFLWFTDNGLEKWEYAPPGKWTAGQHVMHLIQSTKPLINGLNMPALFLTYKFGKRNRPLRTYDQIINRYNERLSEVAGKVQSPFSANMPNIGVEAMDATLLRFKNLNDKLKTKTEKLRNSKMDNCLLPHPLMGRMPIREILMWNAHHCKHHLNILNEKY